MEVIVKYNGNIVELANSLGITAELLSSDYAILTMDPEEISSLLSYNEVEYAELAIRLGLISQPPASYNTSMQASCITAVQEGTEYGLSGEGVIVAILDSGIDYTHPEFRNEDGTSRILYLWDQNLIGEPPDGFNLGVEFTNEQINEALAAETEEAQFDLVPHQDTNGHGSAVAGIAAGKSVGAAPKASLIVVKLASNQSKYFTRSTDIMRAVKYVIDKAKQLNMPVSINISFGTSEGSHMGMTLFEQYLDEASDRWRTSISVASGNEGFARHHYKNAVATGESVVVEFSVGRGITTLSLILWKSFMDDFMFEIISPDGQTSEPAKGIGHEEYFILGNTRVTFLLGQPTPYFEEQGAYFELNGINGREIPASLWKIRITGRNVVEGEFNIWLPITEIVGLDTAFLMPSVATTLTIPSSSEKVITVSGYNPTDGSIADFSGRGSTRNDVFMKPDVAAPAVNITSARPGGGYGVFTGTSFAAPHVCGGAALLMQWGIVLRNDVFLYGQRLKAYLRLGASRNSYANYPDINWGYGRLCVKNTLDQLIKYVYMKGGLNNTPQLSERFVPFIDTSESTATNGDNGNGIDAAAYTQEESLPVFASEASQGEPGINPVIDPAFGDLIVFYNPVSVEELREYPNIYISSILSNKYAIIHAPVSRLTEYENTIFGQLIWEFPVVCGLLDRTSIEVSGITAVQNQPFLDLSGQGVLVAVIDTGIDYTMDIFRHEDGTSKITYLWDQSIEGTHPQSFPYGAEYTQEDIDEANKAENPFSVVPSRDDVGHGTFMASLAAGKDDGQGAKGAAPDADMIIVKLKTAKQNLLEEELIPEGTPAFQSTDIMAAIDYIYEKATRLGKPVAICLGAGTNNGAHDGQSFFERYITEMSVINRMAIVTAAGNEGNLAHHVSGKLAQNAGPYVMELRVGQNESGFILNLWAFAPDRISVSITSPVGGVVQRLLYGSAKTQQSNFVLEKTKINIRYTSPSFRNGDQLVYIRFEDPTPGLWEISVYGDLILDGRFHAWLPVAPFIDQNTAFLSPSAANTATMPATASGVISVGAYSAIDKSIYISSSRGPSTTGLQCPDLCAPGVNAGGYYPMNQPGIMSGTSVSAAITAGAAALILQWAVVKGNDPSINSLKTRSYLIQGCTQREGILYPDDLWGYGELNLIQSFERMKSGRG